MQMSAGGNWFKAENPPLSFERNENTEGTKRNREQLIDKHDDEAIPPVFKSRSRF
jgi:hypothetical protein